MKKGKKILGVFRYLCLSIVVVFGLIAIIGTGGGGGGDGGGGSNGGRYTMTFQEAISTAQNGTITNSSAKLILFRRILDPKLQAILRMFVMLQIFKTRLQLLPSRLILLLLKHLWIPEIM